MKILLSGENRKTENSSRTRKLISFKYSVSFKEIDYIPRH